MAGKLSDKGAANQRKARKKGKQTLRRIIDKSVSAARREARDTVPESWRDGWTINSTPRELRVPNYRQN